MADTLTQEQIDALLNSAMSGEVVEHKDDKKSEAKEYDFRSPKKFTKERIKVLDSIFDNYARLLSSYLTGLLRLYCKVSLASIEEQRYFEFNNSLPDYVMMGTIDLGVNDEEIDSTPTIIQLSNSLTYILIDRLLGGRGNIRTPTGISPRSRSALFRKSSTILRVFCGSRGNRMSRFRRRCSISRRIRGCSRRSIMTIR